MYSTPTRHPAKPLVLRALPAAGLLVLMSLTGASAEGGCGPGFHRNRFGVCRPNGPVVVAPAAPVVAPPPVVVAPPAPVVVAPVACGRGLRWHPRFGRCVVL